jgi:purine-binding chemotaxis protein CheW
MDLAEIRKKARTQGLALTGGGSPLVGGSSAPEVARLRPETTLNVRFWAEIGTEQFSSEEEYTRTLLAATAGDESGQVQWLGFFLGKEEYALDIEVVSELIKPRALTTLPHVPAYVCGIMTLRGEVIPVIDLARRLGLQPYDHGDIDAQRVVVCEGQEQRVGVLVDRISQVVRLSPDEIEKPQLVGENPATAFIHGIGRKKGRMLIQLNAEKIIEIETGGVVTRL